MKRTKDEEREERSRLSRRGFLFGTPLAAVAVEACLPADSAEGGNTTGDCSAVELCGISPSSAPPTSATASARIQEYRPLTSAPKRSQSG